MAVVVKGVLRGHDGSRRSPTASMHQSLAAYLDIREFRGEADILREGYVRVTNEGRCRATPRPCGRTGTSATGTAFD